MKFKELTVEVLRGVPGRIETGETCEAFDFGSDRILVFGAKDIMLCHVNAFKIGVLRLVEV